MKCTIDNNLKHEMAAKNNYISMKKRHNVFSAHKKPLLDWRHVPDMQNDKNAALIAWLNMQCCNHQSQQYGCNGRICITPDGIFKMPTCDKNCRYY